MLKKIVIATLASSFLITALADAAPEKLIAASTTTPEQTNKQSNQKESSNKQTTKEKASSANWQTYTFKENHFSVDLPAKPDHVRQKIDVPKSKLAIEYETFISEPSDETVYVISVWNYPSEVDMSNPETNLKDGFSGMLSALPGSKVIDTNSTTIQGFKALEFLVKNDDVYFQGKLIIAYNTLFQVFTVYRDSVDMTDDYKRFISSFKILNPDDLKMEQHKDAGKNSRLNV